MSRMHETLQAMMIKTVAVLCAVLACSVLLALPASPVRAADRVALVIGNSAYKNTTPLKNPRNDAEGVADALTGMGFLVIKGLDVDQFNLRTLVRAFSRELKDAKLALFFYAGHGLQVREKNFLVPTDARLEAEADLDFEALELRFIMQQMERGERTNVVLLDACRNNPLARNLSRTMGTRSAFVGRGLARVETGVGTFVGFATQPGNVALDGESENSPFTTALLRHLKQPGLDIGVLMRRVREDVIKQTDGQQVPWSNSSLVGDDVVLNTDSRQIVVEPKKSTNETQSAAVSGSNTPSSTSSDQYSAGAANTAIELAFWNSVKDSKNADLLRAYLSQYPQGIFADLAKVMINDLTGGEIKNAAPAQPTSEQKHASVDGQYTQQPEPDKPTGADYSLSLDLQKELNRVGCSAGAADGIWGGKSRAALRRFAKYAGLNLDQYEPSGRILLELRRQNERVCPVVCGARYTLRNNKCYLKTCREGQVLNKRGKCIAKTYKKPVVRKKQYRKKRYKEPSQPRPAPIKPWEEELNNCPQCLTL